MKVLVTGGAGFIGSHIVDLLIEKSYQVTVVDNLSSGKRENVNTQADLVVKDIRDNDLINLFEILRPDYVIHQAAQVSVPRSLNDPLEDAQTNILGLINVLECCRKTGVRKVVFASSAAVYGNPEYLPVDESHPCNPLSPYGISKHTASYYFKIYQELYGLDYDVLRYANVYGPRQDHLGEGGVVTIFINKLLAGEQPVIFGDGNQTRDFVYVGDVARANVIGMEASGCQVVNISTGKEVTVNELYGTIKDELGSKMAPAYSQPRAGDIYRSCLDNSAARKMLGWQPEILLGEGIKKTISFFHNIRLT
ncbi:SDR family oxidoreductase [Candidatus Formimonas warabiya]|uniref:UDP-glucose 4-epimerase n=1 Tax=Formimonas warabiya TaxID=1761012 RepID=A0A3G1L2M2_FORW1|nr:SDR family oxidoreductase [Candidatus Formimonas warabiya]ATW28910.1 UDP-glucose 4-epimerase [Candidatus Formimonas warabiya]